MNNVPTYARKVKSMKCLSARLIIIFSIAVPVIAQEIRPIKNPRQPARGLPLQNYVPKFWQNEIVMKNSQGSGTIRFDRQTGAISMKDASGMELAPSKEALFQFIALIYDSGLQLEQSDKKFLHGYLTGK